MSNRTVCFPRVVAFSSPKPCFGAQIFFAPTHKSQPILGSTNPMIVTVSPSPLKAKQQARRRQAMPCLRNRPKDSSPQKRRERTGNFLRGSGTNKRQRKWGVSWGMGGEGRYGLCGLVRGVSLPKRGLAGILVTSVVLSSPSSPP